MKRWIVTTGLLVALSGPVTWALAAPLSGDVLINQGQEGQTFDYLPKLVHGKVNIIDFYSQYCPPCRAIMPRLEKLAEKDSNLVVLRVDMNRPGIQGIDWASPLARQYKLQSVPHFMVYDANGKLTASDENGHDGYQAVMTLLQQNGL